MAETLAPVIAGLVFGAVLIFAGLLWQVKRPWDVAYRIFFVFFGLFILVGTMGIADETARNALLNLGSSPTISFGNGQLFVSYYNTTGDLMLANSTTNGTSWTVNIVASLDAVSADVTTLSAENLIRSIWLVYIIITVFIAFLLIEIILWFKKLAEEGAGGRSQKKDFGERGEP